MKTKETNHSKLFKELSDSTEGWVAHHKNQTGSGYNTLELILQDNNKSHDTEYFKKKFLNNGFTEIKNKSILEEQSAKKIIKPFIGQARATKVEISSDSFGRTNVRIKIQKTELKSHEIEKLEKAFKKEFLNKNKIIREVKHPNFINSIKSALGLTA